MKRSVGYVLVVLGLVILALGVKPVHDSLVGSVPVLDSVDPIVLLGIGVVLLVIGILIMRKSGGSRRQAPEVPIYEGEDVVGFRRMGGKKRKGKKR
jgi:multisubunit Na+/H+ antiporter MnhB subunit